MFILGVQHKISTTYPTLEKGNYLKSCVPFSRLDVTQSVSELPVFHLYILVRQDSCIYKGRIPFQS